MSAVVQIPFFPSDWLSGTISLTAAERGVYITLLMSVYENGGRLKEDHVRLARLCGMPTSGFTRALEGLVSQGKIMREDGFLTNERATRVIENVKAKSDSARENIKSRWQKNSVKSKYDAYGRNTDEILAKSQKPIAKSIPSSLRSEEDTTLGSFHSPNVNARASEKPPHEIPKTRKPKPKTIPYSEAFEKFWAIFPSTGGGKYPAFEAWLKAMDVLDQGDTSYEHIIEQASRYREWLKRIPDRNPCHATTWLNQRRWEAKYEIDGKHSKWQTQLEIDTARLHSDTSQPHVGRPAEFTALSFLDTSPAKSIRQNS